MKRHIALAVTLSVCLAFCFIAVSPSAKAQGAETAKKLEALVKPLNLTADQKAKLLPILEEEGPKLKAIKADATLTNLQKLEKVRAIHQETDPKVKGILSASQYQQWQTIRQQEMREMMEKKQAQ
jgi:periplasmic protein CpxP/Spy